MGYRGFCSSLPRNIQYLIYTQFSNMLLIVKSYENLERDWSKSSKKGGVVVIVVLFKISICFVNAPAWNPLSSMALCVSVLKSSQVGG